MGGVSLRVESLLLSLVPLLVELSRVLQQQQQQQGRLVVGVCHLALAAGLEVVAAGVEEVGVAVWRCSRHPQARRSCSAREAASAAAAGLAGVGPPHQHLELQLRRVEHSWAPLAVPPPQQQQRQQQQQQQQQRRQQQRMSMTC